MIYIITALALFVMLSFTFIVINREGNKEIRQLSEKDLESFNTAKQSIKDWSDGIYDPIIRPNQNLNNFKSSRIITLQGLIKDIKHEHKN